MTKNERYYVTNFGHSWSLSFKGYLKFLQDESTNAGWNLELPEYEARLVKRISRSAKPINVTNFECEHYKEELKHFLVHGKQTGFNAPNDDKKLYEY